MLYELGLTGGLEAFHVYPEHLSRAVDYVVREIHLNYPTLDIPYHSRWRHFEAGGVDRLASLRTTWQQLTPEEAGYQKFTLAIVSVLLDAGAGAAWQYVEPTTGVTYARSEGLAVATVHMFARGMFDDLAAVTESLLAEGFQVRDDNPLVGLAGRARLIQTLAGGMHPGALFARCASRAVGKTIQATAILEEVLTNLSHIWPGRIVMHGQNLGDVWRHPAIQTADETTQLVPFHKLSQWLTYSLMEPLEEAGYTISDVDMLTGLPEYRNGGLFLDTGVLALKDPKQFNETHDVSSHLVIEWRALTVVLLDLVADHVRTSLGVTAESFPLARVLQGGTWSAGRRIAAEMRPGGTPPLSIKSDGTVF
jgi:hypothetical protein